MVIQKIDDDVLYGILLDSIPECYIISDFLSGDRKDVLNEISKLNELIKRVFTVEKCRHHEIKFKFNLMDDVVHKLQLNDFYFNLIIWSPFIGLDIELDDRYIIHDLNDLTDYINDIIIPILNLKYISIKKINKYIAEVNYLLTQINVDYSKYMLTNLSLFNYIDLYNMNDKFKEHMEFKLDPNNQPSEMEIELDLQMKQCIEDIKQIPIKDNPLSLILNTKGSGMKDKQLQEYMSNGGLKPDLNGNTIPIPLNESLIMNGNNNPTMQYVDASGAIKSLITNHSVMGKAGYFAKNAVMLAGTLELDLSVFDCGTTHLVKQFIRDKKQLKYYAKSFFSKYPYGHYLYSLSELDENDKSVIGTEIYLRMPQTCCCRDKDKICLTCLGKLATLVSDIAHGLGVYGTETYTEQLEQLILSIKHILRTVTSKIDFGDLFNKLFSWSYCDFVINTEDSDILDRYSIIIEENALDRDDYLDGDYEFNTYLKENILKIMDNVSGEIIEILCQSDSVDKLFVSEYLIELLKSTKYNPIKLSDIDADAVIFMIDISSAEVTKPLYTLMHIIGKKDYNLGRTIDDVTQEFVEALYASGIDTPATFAGLIINRLIKDAKNTSKRPNFNKVDVDYVIVPMRNALLECEKPLVALCSDYMRSTIMSNSFYETTGKSYFDAAFSEYAYSR